MPLRTLKQATPGHALPRRVAPWAPGRLACGFIALTTLGLSIAAQEVAPDTPAARPASEKPAPTPDLPAESYREVPLSLQEAILITLQHNLDLRVERLNRDNTLREIAVAISSFDPIFNTSYTISRFREATVSFLSGVNTGPSVAVNPFASEVFSAGISGLLPTGTHYHLHADHTRSDNPDSTFFSLNPRYNPSATLEVTQPLLRNFGLDTTFADYRIAKLNHEISYHQLHRMVEITIAAVVDGYWNVVLARENLAVKEEALLEAEQLLDINQQKLRVGTATEIDVFDAQATIETQKSGIIEARAELQRLQDELLDLMNYVEVLQSQGPRSELAVATYDQLRLLPTTPLELEPMLPSTTEALRMALERRADVHEAELAIENAALEVQRRKDQRLPSLDLRGRWTQEGLQDSLYESTDEFGSGKYYNWTVGVVLEIPIGNRAQRNRLAQAVNNQRAAEHNVARVRNAVLREVRQALRDLQTSQQRIATTGATSRLRSEQLEGEKQRLRVGSSTSYQVLQVQNDLLEARTEEVRARVDHMKAVTAYHTAVGTLLSNLGILVD